MTSEPIISVEAISKCYMLGKDAGASRYRTLREEVTNALTAPFRRQGREGTAPKTRDEEFWALRDISFDIRRSEVVGVIGRNGAGKSTLLKILSRITEPTTGRITLRGRVASLLEVGTGFHPELTGRENIFLNGAILGMHRHEIKAKFDEIVAFAEVAKFLDTPVKRYSSGMYVRLAFAVAAHLEPEILVVDEVLAVGDAEFQKKCLGKMKDVAQGEGRTVLFVSHNMGAVEQLCTRALLLERGQLRLDGYDVRKVVQQYLTSSANPRTQAEWAVGGERDPDSPWFAPKRLRLVDAAGETQSGPLFNNGDIWLEMEAEIRQFDPALNVGYAVYSETNELIYWTCHTDALPEHEPCFAQGYNRVRTPLPKRWLNEGTYRVEVISSVHNRFWIHEPGAHVPVIYFEIQGGLSDSPFWNGKRPGTMAPVIPWESVT